MQLIPGTDSYRYNFWGYSTVNFFSPMSRYSAAAAAGGSGQDVINEFKTMVRCSITLLVNFLRLPQRMCFRRGMVKGLGSSKNNAGSVDLRRYRESHKPDIKADENAGRDRLAIVWNCAAHCGPCAFG